MIPQLLKKWEFWLPNSRNITCLRFQIPFIKAKLGVLFKKYLVFKTFLMILCWTIKYIFIEMIIAI